MDDFWMSLRQNMEKLLKSVNRLDDRHTEEGIEIGARWAREWLLKYHVTKDFAEGLNMEIEKLRLENAKLRGALKEVTKFLEEPDEWKWDWDLPTSWRIRRTTLLTKLKETGGDDVTTDKTPIRE